MKKDKLKVYILESIICIIFFFTLFVSSTYLRIIIASLLILSYFIIKKIIHKKNIISLYHKQATLLLGLLAMVFLLIFYMLGLYFGYGSTLISFSFSTLLLMIIPTALIIIASEMIRNIFLTEKTLISKILTTIGMILIDLTLYTSMSQFETFNGMLDFIAFSLLSSIANNLLWNYTSVRFGYKPSIIFRLIMTLYEFIIPIIPNVFIYLRSFLRMIYPYIIYIILEISYSKNDFIVAIQNKRKTNILTGILLIITILIVMLVSCEFKYGLLIIGTGSMTGTIDIGDAIVYERYEGQKLKEQQIIVFNKNNMKVVHRIIDIKEVNGILRYYTKGDANNLSDSGYITHEDIIGIINFKIKYIGYPTIMLKKMF